MIAQSQPPCRCLSTGDTLRALLEGVEREPCELHEPEAYARARAAKERRAAEAEADYWRTRTAIAREALAEQRAETQPPTSGDPLRDSLTRKLPTRSTLPLNSSPQQMAAAAGFGDAGTPDPKQPFDT